jgi:hypothetical protein
MAKAPIAAARSCKSDSPFLRWRGLLSCPRGALRSSAGMGHRSRIIAKE